MDPIRVNVGDRIEYGQALGTQSDRKTARIHVHMEVDTRYYQHFENYMTDLVSGRLPIDPGRRTQGIEPRHIVDDGVVRIGESSAIVRTVQQHLNNEGFRGADNRPLEVDGVYRLSMQAAVINYQRSRGLPQTGDIDAVTLQEIAPRILPPMQNDAPDGRVNPDRHFLDLNRLGSARDQEQRPTVPQDPVLSQAEKAVRELNRSMGREYDHHSTCLAASIACLAKENGLSRIDHVVLSVDNGRVCAGENVFVVQGGLSDPAQRRACMKTLDAVSTPVDQSLERLRALDSTQQLSLDVAMEQARVHAQPSMRMG